MKTVKEIENLVSALSEEEKELLKLVFKYSGGGSASAEFIDDNGEMKSFDCFFYTTNMNFPECTLQKRRIAVLFKGIYRKLCPMSATYYGNEKETKNVIGKHLSHCRDWWGDGSGDVLFVRYDEYELWEEWAKN